MLPTDMVTILTSELEVVGQFFQCSQDSGGLGHTQQWCIPVQNMEDITCIADHMHVHVKQHALFTCSFLSAMAADSGLM